MNYSNRFTPQPDLLQFKFESFIVECTLIFPLSTHPPIVYYKFLDVLQLHNHIKIKMFIFMFSMIPAHDRIGRARHAMDIEPVYNSVYLQILTCLTGGWCENTADTPTPSYKQSNSPTLPTIILHHRGKPFSWSDQSLLLLFTLIKLSVNNITVNCYSMCHFSCIY